MVTSRYERPALRDRVAERVAVRDLRAVERHGQVHLVLEQAVLRAVEHVVVDAHGHGRADAAQALDDLAEDTGQPRVAEELLEIARALDAAERLGLPGVLDGKVGAVHRHGRRNHGGHIR